MSVFSLDYSSDNPVTLQHLEEACSSLGVTINEDEKKDYHNLLAVYHESMAKLMDMDDYAPPVDLKRFPRRDVHFPNAEENPHGAWAWRCTIKDETDPDGLLKGRSIALKDCIAVQGVPFLLGTEVFTDYIPNMDATLVTRILEAGGVITGRATCENMCHSATSHSAATGPVHNPHAEGYNSGGSSSGCAVLVANGDVDMAIGADQGGSIRVPAGWCGIYGLKPTYGLVPFTGCASNEPTNDHAGPMTTSILDNALLLQAIAGTDGIDDRSFGSPTPDSVPRYYQNLKENPNPTSLSGMRIGILEESLTMPALDPRVKKCFLDAAERFKELGAIVETVSVPFHKHAGLTWTGVSKLNGYLTLMGGAGRRGYFMNDLIAKKWPLTQQAWDKAIPSTKNILLNGAYAQKHFPGLLGKATNLSRKLRDEYNRALDSYDVLILPNLPYVANSHARPDATPIEQLQKQVGLTSNTAPFNQSGHPVLAMPIGMLPIIEGPKAGSGTKLPVSLQIAGKWYGEEKIYRAAYAYSLKYDWKGM